ncbi:HD-GYP domain-containing protein [Phosphitispora sp. TUW77]|uniref:HD-GYP domain-containing protein n=1 Tax=Phosphitispora sp. TUW77 TaxID=3152361 RepID=UPI003AB2FF5E
MFNYINKHQLGPGLVLLVFILGILVNFLSAQALGGIFIIGIVLAGLLISSELVKWIIFLLAFGYSVYANLINEMPITAFVMKQIVFLVTISFAMYTGRQLRKYINQMEERQREIKGFNRDIIMAFINTIEAKDDYLYGHSLNVACYASRIAEQMKLSKEECKRICLAGIFHDIGKIGVSELILNKMSGLNEEEWQEIRKHPVIGSEIISKIGVLRGISDIIKYHHLHYDGSGYPPGSKGESIPLGARIIAVADCYDAMTSERAYRKVLLPEAACRELERCSGTQLDPQVVKAFLECYELGLLGEEYKEDAFEEVLDCFYRHGF